MVMLQAMEFLKPKLHYNNNLFKDLLIPNVLVIYNLNELNRLILFSSSNDFMKYLDEWKYGSLFLKKGNKFRIV